MKKSFFLSLFALVFSMAGTLTAGEKARYDMSAPTDGALAKTTALGADRWTISRSVAGASIVEGGYFTLGTTAGTSQLALDDNCGITYGHPYAKTSYPLVYIDGAWGKPEKFFPSATTDQRQSGDSLIYTSTVAAKYELRFTIWLEENGTKIHLATRMKNLDAAVHTFGVGLVIDPALGKTGDGFVRTGTTLLERDTLIAGASLALPVTISERPSTKYGLRLGLTFPVSTPATFIAANWEDPANSDTPSFTASDVKKLYDAVLKLFWTPAALQANAVIEQEAVVTVMAPNFGTGVFLRWDAPTSQAVENGAPFPKNFASHVTVDNLSSSTVSSIEVELVPPIEVQASTAARTPVVNGNSSTSLLFPLTFTELYINKVVDLLVLCKQNNVVIDSLVHPFRICSSPVSDTGLTVRFDSVMAAAYPKVMLTFDVMKQATRQNIFTLTRDNILFTENGQNIDSYAFGKDTTGGIGAVDIVFVLDVTGSMSGSINGVKSNITEFADSLSARGVNFRLGMVTFLDIIENVYDFTTSVAAFKANVGLQYAHGGGDAPENSLDALFRATQMPFREGAKRVFIWITDNSFHEKDVFTTRTRGEVITQLLSVDAVVHAIGDKSYQTDWYNPITQATGGNYYDINGNFRDILLDIGNLKGTNRYLISYTSQQPKTTQKELRITVHYAGFGGTSAVILGGQSLSMQAAAPVSCFPNPFNPQTTIRLTIPSGTHGTVVIYNVLGQQVRSYTLAGKTGSTDIIWGAKDERGRDVATGLYFIRYSVYSSDNRLVSADVAKILYLK